MKQNLIEHIPHLSPHPAAVFLPLLADVSDHLVSPKASPIPTHSASPLFIPDSYFKGTEAVAHSLREENVLSKLKADTWHKN